jgi:hypothetical protein
MRRQNDWSFTRRLFLNVRTSSSWNYDSLRLGKMVSTNGWIQLRNFWWLGGGAARAFQTYDDRETRGGPAVIDPAWREFWMQFESDDREAITVGGEYQWWTTDLGGSWGKSVEGGITFRPTTNVELRFRPEYRWRWQHARWIDNFDEDADGEDDTFVFGALKSRTLDLTTRANITFTRNLTLQLYVQPFIATGDYGEFKALARPNSYEFVPHPLPDDRDFSRRSLKSNVILRWEYRPGSTLFAVWSQSRSFETDDPTFRLDTLSHALADEGTNIFLVKANYWLGL